MDAGSLVLLRKHAVYLCIAAWRIITHFHIVVPWALVPVILAFRVPYIEPIEFDLKSVMVSKLPECTNYSFSTAVQKVRTSCADSKAEPPIEYNETTHPKSFDPKRCTGYLFFPSIADADNFMTTEAGSGARGKLTDYEFSDSHSWTSLLESKTIQDGVIFGEYLGIVSFLISMCVVGAIFFMMREYFRWDTFVLRSPALASCIAAARVATTMFLIFKAFQKFLYIRPLLAAAGSIACSIIILIPVSIVASRLPQGRLSSLFSYTTRIACTGIAVPVVWHVIFVENVINPVAGPVFTDSTPSTVMTCFWFVGAIVGLMLHSSMDKQVRHMAPALNQQGLLFALEALRFTFVYASVEFLLSFLVVVLGNFSEIVLGEFGDFNPSLIGRMFFATAFCTFITWTGAQYVAACLDPHPSCSLSISDARLLADGSTSSLYTGHAAYRAYYRVRVVAAAFLRWCRCNPDRALECAFKTSEIFNPSDPVKGSIIVDAFCHAIDGYGKDLQNIKAQLDVPPFSSQSIFLFNWFWLVVRWVSFILFGHGPDLSIVQSNAHSIAAAVRALSAVLVVADERVCTSSSVAAASTLQPRVLLSPVIFVKAYTSIANLARDIGQLQRTLNDKPFHFSLLNLKPGAYNDAWPTHPLTKQKMYPVDPRFVDVSDACHSAMTQLRYSSRYETVLTEMGKGSKESMQAKRRLEFMSTNGVLPPALPSFVPSAIKNHRHASSLVKPSGRLSLSNQPSRNEVYALDPNLEYLVSFEGVPDDQDAWVPLPDGTAIGSDNGRIAQRYTDLLLPYINRVN